MAQWRIGLPADKLASLKTNASFAELLTLARIANALRFAIATAYGDSNGIVGQRQRTSSFLLTGATVAEALHTLQRTRQHFRHLPAYGELVAPLLGDIAITDFRSKVLKWLRDKAVFHHDKDVAPSGLADLEGEWTFAEGDSLQFMDTAYPLADFVVVRAMLAEMDTPKGLVQTFADVLQQTLELARSIVVALDTLIGQSLNEHGLVFQEEP